MGDMNSFLLLSRGRYLNLGRLRIASVKPESLFVKGLTRSGMFAVECS